MPGDHALLSASASGRWMNCPPSALLCEGIADEGSGYAEEGTEAHALCEHKLRLFLGMETRDPRDGMRHLDRAMEDISDDYVAFVSEIVEEARKAHGEPSVMVEQRLDFSAFVPGGFGTGDCVVVSDGELNIIDLKYGKGVEVSAEGNTQMMLYALGACGMLGGLYDIASVTMTIYQPRIGNISTSSMTRDALYGWAEDVLRPKALLASEGGGELKAGGWCRFCKVKGSCAERARMNMEIAAYEFREPGLLSDAETADILSRVGELVAWAEDVKAYALAEATRGRKYPGFKLVEGRSVRRYTDEDAVAEAVCGAGYDPWQKSVLGITAMTGMIGKAAFGRLLGRLVVKPRGKPVLVPACDRRPEIGTNDFKDMEEEG